MKDDPLATLFVVVSQGIQRAATIDVYEYACLASIEALIPMLRPGTTITAYANMYGHQTTPHSYADLEFWRFTVPRDEPPTRSPRRRKWTRPQA